MFDNDKIIENVNATMSMEGMPLTKADKELLAKCLSGEVEFNKAVSDLVKHYTKLAG